MAQPSLEVAIFRSILVMLVLVSWPALSSHALLEAWGIIHHQGSHHSHHYDAGNHHHDHDEHSQEDGSGFNHDFADGSGLRSSGTFKLKPSELIVGETLSFSSAPSSVVGELLEALACYGLPPPGVAPPHIRSSWHFALRTALPARAPSLLS